MVKDKPAQTRTRRETGPRGRRPTAPGADRIHRNSREQPETTDERLVELYHLGDAEALDTLLVRYRGFTRMKAHSYFIVGADREDIVQEGLIGLYKAIRDYKGDREASFRTFAEICITRQIVTAIKAATRQKHTPLNQSIPLHGSSPDDDSTDLAETLPTVEPSDPLELLIASEDMESMRLCFAEVLSDLEAEVLHLYVEGKTYQEIGDRLGRHTKAIDNAVQRIKKKLELAFSSEDRQAEQAA